MINDRSRTWLGFLGITSTDLLYVQFHVFHLLILGRRTLTNLNILIRVCLFASFYDKVHRLNVLWYRNHKRIYTQNLGAVTKATARTRRLTGIPTTATSSPQIIWDGPLSLVAVHHRSCNERAPMIVCLLIPYPNLSTCEANNNTSCMNLVYLFVNDIISNPPRH